ncbi:MAG: TlpA disulfide reductase family protein [Bacteroidota bacterium]
MQRFSRHIQMLLFLLMALIGPYSYAQQGVVKQIVAKPDHVNLKGNLKNLSVYEGSTDVFTFQYNDLQTGKNIIVPIVKDPEGNFTSTIFLKDVEKIRLTRSRQFDGTVYDDGTIDFLFFARPGEDMELNYFFSGDFKTRKIEFKGNFADVNNHYSRYTDSLDHSYYSPLFSSSKIDSLSSEDYVKFERTVSERLTDGLAYNKRYFDKTKADPYVVAQANADMKYQAGNLLVSTVLRSKLKDTITAKFFRDHKLLINDPDSYANDFYKSFLFLHYRGITQMETLAREIDSFKSFGDYLFATHHELDAAERLSIKNVLDSTSSKNKDQLQQVFIDYVEPYLDDYFEAQNLKEKIEHCVKSYDVFIRDIFLYRLMSDALTRRGVFVVIPIIETYKQKATSAFLKDQFITAYNKEYDKVFKSKPSAKAILNNAKQLTGDRILTDILKKHIGKVIYIDVWATWCVPCLDEMKNAKVLRDKLKDKDIVFVNLCISSARESQWKQLIAYHEIEGENYFLNPVQSMLLKTEFMINSIPRYMVVDKSGFILNDNAGRPGRKETITLINSLL